jgi:glycogen debranching enzyme
VDQALKLFSDEISESKWEHQGIQADFCEQIHLEAYRAVLAQEILPKLRLHEFYQLDVDRTVDQFKEHCLKNNAKGKDGPLEIIQDPLYRRFGSTIDLDVAVNLFNADGVELFRSNLEELNEEKLADTSGHLEAIINASLGHVHYERISKEGPRKSLIDKDTPLTAK